MAPRTLATLLCLALLVTVPLGLTQGAGQGTGEAPVEVGVFAGEDEITAAQPGQLVVLRALVEAPAGENTSWRAFLNASVDGRDLPGSQQSRAGPGIMELLVPFNTPADADGNVTVTYDLTIQSLYTGPRNASADGNVSDANGTGGNRSADTNATADAGGDEPPEGWQDAWVLEGETITLDVRAPMAPPTGPPWGLIGGIGAVVLIVAGVVAYLKWPRQYRHEAGPRSRTLQEMQEESRGGDTGGGAAAAKHGAEKAVATQEPKVHPQLKILEARARDVRRMIELARERHERGDITEHQFNMIREKKEAELQEIEEEMDEHRSGQGS